MMKGYLKNELHELIFKNEKAWELLNESSNDGMLLWDLKTPENIWFNASFWKLLGFVPFEAENDSALWKTVIDVNDLEFIRDELEDHSTNSESIFSRMFKAKTKDGSFLPIRFRGIIIRDQSEEPVRLIGFVEAISSTYTDSPNLMLDQIIDQSPFAMWISDANGLIIRINAAQQRLLGIPEQNFVGVYNVLEDEIAEKAGLMPQIKSVFEKGETICFTLSWDGKDMPGSSFKESNTVIGQTTMFPVFGKDGDLSNVVVQWIDVTQETEARNQLIKSEEKYKDLFENSPSMMANVDHASGLLIDCNKTFCEKTGFSKEEIIGKHILERYESRIEAENAFSGFLETGSVNNKELRLKTKTGEGIDVLLNVSSVQDEFGNAIYSRSVWQDISERKAAEAKIKDNLILFNSFIENFPDDAWTKDLNGKLTLVNRHVKEVTLRNKELLGKSVFDLFPPNLAKSFKESEQKVIAHGEIIKTEEDIPQPDGIHNKILTKFPLLNSQGEITGLGAFAHDITRRKQSEARLAASQKMAKLGSFEHDFEQDTQWWSDELYQILGHEKEEIPPCFGDFLNRIPEEDATQLAALVQKAQSKGEDYSFTFAYQIPGLPLKYIAAHAEVEFDQSGKPKGLRGTAQDVSELKLAEFEVINSQQRYQSLFDNAPIPIWEEDFSAVKTKIDQIKSDGVSDLKTYYKSNTETVVECSRLIRVLDANKAAVALHEANSKEQLFEGLPNLFTDRSLQGFTIELLAVAEGETQCEFESSIQTINGKEKQILLNWQVVPGYENTLGKVYVSTSDITALKEAEATISESEAKFRSIFEDSNVGIAIASELGDVIEVNDEYLNVTGYSRDEFLGLNYADITHPEDIDHEKELFQKILSGKTSNYRIKKRLLGKNDQYVWLDTCVTIHKKQDGEFGQMVAVAVDITEQKKAEDQLRASEEKLRLAIDNSPLGICINDMDAKFVSANKAYQQMLGYTESELKTMTFYDVTHPDFLPQNENLFGALKKKVAPGYVMEKKYIHKNGQELDVRIHTGTIANDDGDPVLGLAFCEDISIGKVLERKNAMLSKAIESSPIAVVITDPQANIEYTNPRFTEITGYTENEVIGKNPRILKSGFHPRSFYTEMWNQLKQGKPWIGELQNVKKDGELYWENSAISPVVGSDGRTIHYVCVKEDITSLKAMLSDLKEAKKNAEQANALKTEFLHNMSHEIRTPMNGIMGFSSLLDDPEITKDEQQYYTRIIQNSSEQLLRIIDDILEISTLETKQLCMREGRFDLNEFMMDLFSVYDIKSKTQNLPLYIKKGLTAPESIILSDRKRLQKVICNLLDNAFKFTRTGCVEFGYFKENEHLNIFVKDTGIGISPDNQRKIFERFSQESHETAENFGGLGLGLSIAKENTELLGGELTLHSAKGQGATFTIKIPYKKCSDQHWVDGSDNGEEIEGYEQTEAPFYTILIVDDEEVNFLYLEALLAEMNGFSFKLIHATDGNEAVDLCLANNSIDLVLMDIKMPRMNGYKATEIIKKQFPQLPVIAQTAYSTNSEKNEAIAHGLDDFISKPIAKESFYHLIQKYLPTLN